MRKQLTLAVLAALYSAGTAAAGVNGNVSLGDSRFELQSRNQHWSPDVRQATPISQSRYIVQLESDPIATYRGGLPGLSATAKGADADKLNLNAANVSQYRNHLDAEVEQFRAVLATRLPSTKVSHRFATLFNGVAVSGGNLSLAQLAALPGVKAVYPERIYTTEMDASLDLINAPAVWEQLGGRDTAGAGVRVAIIDSGIRPEHEMFAGEGFTAPSEGMPVDDYCSTIDANFCNDKLIVARWSAPTFPVWEQEHMSPLGFDGHGTHVAGTAVGNKVDINFLGQDVTVSGVAPGAYLMAYKALFATASDPTRASGSNIMLLEALEHAVNDGADVINNSWGGSAGMDPAFSPYKAAFEAAEAAGVVIATSAGNSGSGPQTIGCPGCIEAGITVANTTHGRFFANELSVGSLSGILSVEGTSSARLQSDITAPVIASADVDAINVEGCEPFAEGSFTDSIALISRGSCAFLDKANHAADAGAVALVVYNNRDGQPITMSMDDATIPAVMVSQASGEAILTELGGEGPHSATIAAAITRIVDPEFADNTASSSSRGPNGDPNILKPDIAAPGSAILSAMSPEEPGREGATYALLSGTSMASPHIAGAAALMREMHPDWSAVEIKTALTSSATLEGLTKEDAATAADPFDVGAGRVDLDAASDAVLTFDKASYANAACITGCRFTATVTNRGDSADSWALSAMVDGAAVTVSPATLELAAGESSEFTVAIDPTFADKGAWRFGKVQFSGNTDAHLPLAIFPDVSTDASMVSIYGDAPTLTYGEEGTYHAVFANKGFEGTVSLTLMADENLTMVEDSASITATDASQTGMEIDETNGRLSWVGRLGTQSLSVAPLGVLGLPSFATPDNQISCSGGCDEVSFVYNVPSFSYGGQDYGQITVSDNGFVAAGNVDTTGSWNNQRLPDGTAPNNVIAPFWADMDLTDGTAGDTGGGSMHIFGISDQAGDLAYIGIEWKDAQLWDDTSGNTYSFGVWLGVGAYKGENAINIIDLGPIPANVTVGAEDISGAVGDLLYYNGEGSAPVNGLAALVQNEPGGIVNMDFALSADVVDVAADDSAETLEEAAVTVVVVENDKDTITLPLMLKGSHEGTVIEALHLVDVAGAMPTGITITEEPANGSVVVNEDLSLTYTPNLDFAGTDAIGYDALDEQGMVIGSATVDVTVTNVNDAPVATAPAAASVVSGKNVNIALSADDVDGDDLTWQVTQTSGTAASFSVSGNTLTVNAPSVSAAETLTFAAVASDAALSSEPVTVTVEVTPPADDDSGSLGWLVLLLAPLALTRRRK
ncbi:S8 family serine peptidase [Ferrimonas balearica]|uniref:S8 family serine peptidase n=1 Tax=Ferrimonas balearica TaxID=44012 RepID=UPI001C99C424|nr:S8 family serine peptidase [Ferrimonas balearica]MBY5922928.1 S8 family serine peptidase [Ferrimonas balearica]MBY5997695.1 S8 family serine peptidase [Ferrimonas balearica]